MIILIWAHLNYFIIHLLWNMCYIIYYDFKRWKNNSTKLLLLLLRFLFFYPPLFVCYTRTHDYLTNLLLHHVGDFWVQTQNNLMSCGIKIGRLINCRWKRDRVCIKHLNLGLTLAHFYILFFEEGNRNTCTHNLFLFPSNNIISEIEHEWICS